MNQLASALASIIKEKIEQAALNAASEARLIFHGPPLEILEDTYELLFEVTRSATVNMPVVLRVPALRAGEFNPPVGTSGRCDETHLLNLRNSPARPTYVALVPPGQHSNRSVATTTDEFGMMALNNAGNVPFEDWWADEFIQDLAGRGIANAGIAEGDRDNARALVEHAASAADEIDLERTQRAGAWRVLSRLFDASEPLGNLSAMCRLSLACGVPRMLDGGLSSKEQIAILDKLADALADSFNSGITRAQEGASDDDGRGQDDRPAKSKREIVQPPGLDAISKPRRPVLPAHRHRRRLRRCLGPAHVVRAGRACIF